MTWLIGLLGSVTIAGLAYWKRSLSGSGFAMAVAVGTVLYAAGSLAWFGTLIAFFVSSSLLSKWKHRQKAAVESTYEKSGRRDAGQVLANGGLAALLVLANAVAPHPLWWAAFIGVMATVTADTWATEIGGLSRVPPRSIRTLRPVAPGTSGGITGLGLLASVLGGLFIGLVAALLLLIQPSQSAEHLVPLALLGGLVGSLTDSWLGATVQRLNRCPVCHRELEAARHCGTETHYHRGVRWLNNDAVNLIASAAGGLAVLMAVALF
ncbi:DUF92 domain-containing protein [Tumebacillus sp. DT12]|uniref:DUF92 domain-containing protein n=1 Tax=Tumebacillus lacus TaxID=2995335 RepID=A0ABT3X242_9BACL|nr:DUF92 domain-containing protein [Tumebacillus lacus]MCX7570993.1 DUF92 domain-containing protein [Tumebacillus lacus]